MEAAAEALAAAKRQRESERREEAISEVEMVLQTYFHNLDNSYNKLQTINEYMDDVEVRANLDSVCESVNTEMQTEAQPCDVYLKVFTKKQTQMYALQARCAGVQCSVLDWAS